MKLVKEKKILEKVFADINWDFETTPQKIFDFFKNPPVEDMEIPEFEFDSEKLTHMMVEENDFSEERIDSILKKVKDTQDDKKQSNLQKFFG